MYFPTDRTTHKTAFVITEFGGKLGQGGSNKPCKILIKFLTENNTFPTSNQFTIPFGTPK